MRTDRQKPLREPSHHELRAIEREWPRIAADMAALDAEITALAEAGSPLSELDRRRVRRSESRRLRAAVEGARTGGMGGAA